MPASPSVKANPNGDVLNMAFYGMWTSSNADEAEKASKEASSLMNGSRKVNIDLSQVERIDTMGALLLARFQIELKNKTILTTISGAKEEVSILLGEVERNDLTLPKSVKNNFRISDIIADLGETIFMSGKDLLRGTAFLGNFIAALWQVCLHPKRFRFTALVNQIEKMAFRGAPIIILISFLVGAIIAQQSLFQLASYGTSAFVADLLGILILRELAVLLTAIMMAGRSGSSITAELGSMKMREEIDALQTMGLDPVETLVIPRVLALIIAMPILTFISSMSGLLGGGIVALVYGNVSPDIFISRLQASIGLNTFLVGMIKAPFMALVIGLIACVEGLAVKGSAESLGSQTTASVVKSIFMVIVVDGLFAMFFAAINY